MTDSPNNKLKIAVISASDSGGAGRAAYRQHRALIKQGADSNMFVLHRETNDPTVKVLPGFYQEGIITDAVENDPAEVAWKKAISEWKEGVKEYPDRPAGYEQFSPPLSSVRLDLVRDILEADVVHLHWMPGVIDFETCETAFKDKPVVWTMHDMNPFTGGCHYSAGCRKFEDRCGSCPQLGSKFENDLSKEGWQKRKNLYESLNIHVIALSRWLGSIAASSSLFGNLPVHYIPNSLPTDIYKPRSNSEMKNKLGISREDHFILFGADSVKNKRKGFTYLLKALEILAKRKSCRNIVLGFFGRIKENVLLPREFRAVPLGSIRDEGVLAAVYSAADAFILPSLEDNLPNTLLESLACGTPVIGFNIGGIPDVIENRVTGYLAEPFEASGIADGIEWAINEQARGVDFSTVCRDKVKQDFSEDRQASALLELYSALKTENASATSTAQNENLNDNQYRDRSMIEDQNSRLSEDNILRGDDIPAAMLHFRSRLEKNMNDPDALSGLALSMLRAGETDVAMQLMAQTLTSHSENETVLKRVFEVFKNAGEWIPTEKQHLLSELFILCCKADNKAASHQPALA